MQISARGILATITASAGQNRNFSKVGTVYVYLLSNFRFDNNLLHVLGYQYMSNNVVSCCYILHWNLCIYKLSLVCFGNYNISPPEKVKFSHKLMSWGIVVLFDITKVKSQQSVLCIFSVLKKLNNNWWIHIKVTVLNAIFSESMFTKSLYEWWIM
jgi:hypothetical protein